MKKIFDLTGQVAIVTGAARGIGKAIALGFAHFGADVVAVDILEKEVKETAAEIKKLGRESLAIKMDVTKKKDIENVVKQTMKKFGKIDILVNNAGVLRMGPPEAITEKEWDFVMNINLKGYFQCSQVVGREMIKKKQGRIINIASIAGKIAFSQAAAYNASKGGVILLTESLADDWARYNIRVNAIAPGVVKTHMTAGMLKDKGFQEMVKAKAPIGRAAEPEEIAGAAIFLASNASSYITGEVIDIDGGWTTIL